MGEPCNVLQPDAVFTGQSEISLLVSQMFAFQGSQRDIGGLQRDIGLKGQDSGISLLVSQMFAPQGSQRDIV